MSDIEAPTAKEATYQKIKEAEKTLARLRSEHSNLSEQVNASVPSQAQIHSVLKFVSKVKSNLPKMRNDFTAKRRAIELLDVRISLSIEDGQKWVYVTCYFGREKLLVETTQIGFGVMQKPIDIPFVPCYAAPRLTEPDERRCSDVKQNKPAEEKSCRTNL